MSASIRPGADVAIIGAGIVGLSCAFHLQQRGLRCVLIDPKGPGGETSFGNAGSISVGNLLPQATPGIAWKGIKMLLDPLAPLKFDLARLPTYARWLCQFVDSSRTRAMLPTIDALHAINSASRAAWLQIAATIDADDLLAHSGYLHVYSRAETFAAALWERQLMHARGVRFDVLDTHQLRALEPDIGTEFKHGMFQRDALALGDPGAFCLSLHAWLSAHGMADVRASVMSLKRAGGAWELGTTEGNISAAQVVVAAGAWSTRLLRSIGIDVPVIPARGYHLMFPTQARVASRPTLWAERYLVMTPMNTGIRVTSVKELTALDRAPRFALIDRLEPEARRLFPALGSSRASQWAGFRPCTPDSLPIIEHDAANGLHLAIGHGHLGLTQGPISGQLIAQSVLGETPTLSMTPYRRSRFSAKS